MGVHFGLFIRADYRRSEIARTNTTLSRGAVARLTPEDVNFHDRTVFLPSLFLPFSSFTPPPTPLRVPAVCPRRNLVNALRSLFRTSSFLQRLFAALVGEEHRFPWSRLLRRDAAGKLQRDKSLKSLSRRLQNAGWRDSTPRRSFFLFLAYKEERGGSLGKTRTAPRY